MAHNWITSYVALVLLFALLLSTGANGYCAGEDYSPCLCDQSDPNGWRVTCSVPMNEVLKVFQRVTTRDVYKFELYTSLGESSIPADLLVDKRFTIISIYCSKNTVPLTADVNAFRSSENFTQSFFVRSCNVSQLDWSLLNGFQQLRLLSVSDSTELTASLPTLPTSELVNLDELVIGECPGLGSEPVVLPDLPPANGLTSFRLHYNNDLTDSVMDQFLDWVLQSSALTLKELWISNNRLITRIPPQLPSFASLDTVYAHNNQIPQITGGSLTFTSPLNVLELDFSGILAIEPGSFRGNFSGYECDVNLASNKLTRFEANVFKDLLQQLQVAPGRLDVFGNPFDCTTDPCHLAWLIRDHRELLRPLNFAQCSDGTYFDNLDVNDFADCPTSL